MSTIAPPPLTLAAASNRAALFQLHAVEPFTKNGNALLLLPTPSPPSTSIDAFVLKVEGPVRNSFVSAAPTNKELPTVNEPSVFRLPAPARYRFVSIAARVVVPHFSPPLLSMLKLYAPPLPKPENRYALFPPCARTCIAGPSTSAQTPSMVGSELGGAMAFPVPETVIHAFVMNAPWLLIREPSSQPAGGFQR